MCVDFQIRRGLFAELRRRGRVQSGIAARVLERHAVDGDGRDAAANRRRPRAPSMGSRRLIHVLNGLVRVQFV